MKNLKVIIVVCILAILLVGCDSENIKVIDYNGNPSNSDGCFFTVTMAEFMLDRTIQNCVGENCQYEIRTVIDDNIIYDVVCLLNETLIQEIEDLITN